jgi:2-dehydropantoate 2-reductase
MKFLIAGPGAMGCLFAARLKRAGFEVVLLDYRPERADHISRNGIKVKGIKGEYTVFLPVVTDNPKFIPDVVMICVKANLTRIVSKSLDNWLGPEASVLTLQNGLGNIDVLEDVFGTDRALGGVTSEGATLMDPGSVYHAGTGQTVIGSRKGSGVVVQDVVSAFNTAGFDTRAAANVTELIWGKLIVNVAINALTAITGLKNGYLTEIEDTNLLMKQVVLEAQEVARAKGIRIPYSAPFSRANEVCRATADNISSMLQDVLHHKATEVEFINGAIVREGESLGIPTPVNQTLTLLVQTIQKVYGLKQK